MRHDKEDFIAQLLLHREVRLDDVLRMRREIFADGIVSLDEADCLFKLNDAFEDPISEWNDFFVQALTNFFLYQQKPSGFITASDGNYLISKVWQDERVKSATELELIVHLIDRAQTCPDALRECVIREVKESVLTNSGPLRDGHFLKAGVIDAAEVAILERVLFGMASEGSLAISRAEAELLFDLNDATIEAENHPSWRKLFVKGISNYLMSSLSYAPMKREERIAQDAFLESRGSMTGIFGKMGQSLMKGPMALLDVITAPVSADRLWDEELSRRQEQSQFNERITAAEADWVINRIGKDGVLHDNEKALLSFIRDHARTIPPVLQSLLQKAG